MSLLRSIRAQLGLMSGGNESQNHFFDGSVPNQLTLKRGVPDAPGAEIIKVLNGVLSFPNQGQSLGANGYIKLPGGLIVQWGVVNADVAGVAVVFPTTFPAYCAVALASPNNGGFREVIGTSVPSTSGMTVYSTSAIRASWIAIGY